MVVVSVLHIGVSGVCVSMLQNLNLRWRWWKQDVIENVVRIFLFHSLFSKSRLLLLLMRLFLLLKRFMLYFLVLIKKMKEKMKEIKDVVGVDEPLKCLSFFISFFFYFLNSTI
jgi:hypothetical protein